MKWEVAFLPDFKAGDFENAYKNLSALRKKRIDRLKLKEDKERSLLAEILLKKLLKEEKISYESIESAENGKPFLLGSNRFISISHSENAVACAIGKTPVGIDIQKIKPIKTALVKRVCSPEELRYVLKGEPQTEKPETLETEIKNPETLNRFFEVWTTKEALFKKENSKTPFTKLNALSVEHKTEKIKDFIVTIV